METQKTRILKENKGWTFFFFWKTFFFYSFFVWYEMEWVFVFMCMSFWCWSWTDQINFLWCSTYYIMYIYISCCFEHFYSQMIKYCNFCFCFFFLFVLSIIFICSAVWWDKFRKLFIRIIRILCKRFKFSNRSDYAFELCY